MKNVVHPQTPAEVQHAPPIFAAQEGHDDALQGPPPDPDEDDPEPPLEELELAGAPQEPPAQTWPDAQAVQASPPEPHADGSVPPWHMLFMSQHPLGQDDPEHPVASSPPPDPLSSALLLDPVSS
jgi:hypothetical protein